MRFSFVYQTFTLLFAFYDFRVRSDTLISLKSEVSERLRMVTNKLESKMGLSVFS